MCIITDVLRIKKIIYFYFGRLKEAISLIKHHGLVPECQAGRSIGYRQALEYLQSVWGYPTVSEAACVQVCDLLACRCTSVAP